MLLKGPNSMSSKGVILDIGEYIPQNVSNDSVLANSGRTLEQWVGAEQL